jgi:hypothetical protein
MVLAVHSVIQRWSNTDANDTGPDTDTNTQHTGPDAETNTDDTTDINAIVSADSYADASKWQQVHLYEEHDLGWKLWPVHRRQKLLPAELWWHESLYLRRWW